MPKKYPPLTPSEVRSILIKLNFVLDRTVGDHEQWKDNGHTITLKARLKSIGIKLIKSMIKQSGHTRNEFYQATKKTSKKIQ